jgi:hypothetical protein
VKRLLALLVVAGVLTSVSCGDILVRGAINPGTQSTSGLVTIVQFSAASGSGVSITVITLAANGMASTLNFCGDQRTRFPVNSQVHVSFMPGNPCASVIAVVLG